MANYLIEEYNYGSMRFNVFGHWATEAEVEIDNPDYYTLEYEGKEFGRVFRKSGMIMNNKISPPTYESVIEFAQKEIIPEAEKTAKDILSVVESREDRFVSADVRGSFSDFSAKECHILISELYDRIREIEAAEKLIGKMHYNLSCYECKVKFQIRGDSKWPPEICIPCYEKHGKKSGCIDYKELGGRKSK